MVTLIENNDSYSNPHDDKDDNGDGSDNNADETMNAQITRHIYMEDF